MSVMSKEYYDEIELRALGNQRPRVESKPVLAVAKGKEVAHTKPADAKPIEAVIDAATVHNNAITQRLETMEGRRQARIAKEFADYHAENPHWHALCNWQNSVLEAQERIRANYGEIPEKGIYSPVARFEREMEGK
jgi:hypothetical protein